MQKTLSSPSLVAPTPVNPIFAVSLWIGLGYCMVSLVSSQIHQFVLSFPHSRLSLINWSYRRGSSLTRASSLAGTAYYPHYSHSSFLGPLPFYLVSVKRKSPCLSTSLECSLSHCCFPSV